MKIEIKILNTKFYSEESNGMLLNPLPDYATAGSAALDLICTEDVIIAPGEIKLIPTGLAIWIGDNKGMAGLILPRSGLGTKGLILANTVGVIDEDYQGELMVSAWNRNEFNLDRRTNNICSEFNFTNDIKIEAGQRFAQLMFIPVIKAQWMVVKNFSNSTGRGQEGFGSTGS